MILIRHGQSEFNVRFAETQVDPMIRDPHLTDLGRRQIEQAAHFVAEHHLSALKRIVSSPYTRTLQSATILSELLDLPIDQVDVQVGEHAHFTCDLGSSRTDLQRDWPHLDFQHLAEEWWPDKEEEHQVDHRAMLFRDRMAALQDWEETLVVTHWGFLRSLTGHRVTNATVIRLDPTQPHPAGAEVVCQPDVC